MTVLPEVLGNLMMVLHSHIPYVLSHGKSPHGTDWLNESAAESYLPILNTCERLVAEGISPKFTINITPILQEQLADASFQAELTDYLQSKIDYAISDCEAFVKNENLWQSGLAFFWKQFYSKRLEELKHKYNYNILNGFKKLQDEGHIEIITSAATHGYLPLIINDECVQAQVKLGVQTYRKHFERDPKGIWLPECAYRPAYPWSPPVGPAETAKHRKGVEEFLAENGIEFFFVDSHMLRGGMPIGTYAGRFPALHKLFKQFKKSFEEMESENRSEYDSYWVGDTEHHAPVACYARDPETTLQVWSGSHGYPGDQYYLEFHKMLYPGRLRYWRISEVKEDLGSKALYEPLKAFEEISHHADHFVELVKNILRNYKNATGKQGCMVSMYDTELYGHWWFEGPIWLYEIYKRIANDPEINLVTGSEQLAENPPTRTVRLPEGSWGEGGYHYVWLNEQNAWTWERIYPCERKLVELARKYRSNDSARPIIEQAARELLLMESSDWQFLISTWSARDYAEIRVHNHISNFESLAAMAEIVAEGGSLSEEQTRILDDCKMRNTCFKEIDLSMWAKLDYPLEYV